MDPNDIPLRDIHLPDPITWWPPATGWWWLGAALILVVCATGFFIRWRFQQRHIRAALKRVQHAFDDYRVQPNGHLLAKRLSKVMRHTATLELGPKVAGIAGPQWRAIDEQQRFSDEQWQIFEQATYSQRFGESVSTQTAEHFIETVSLWLQDLPAKQRFFVTDGAS